MKMQLNIDLIFDRINKGIKESVESLHDYPGDIGLAGGRSLIAEFFNKDSITEERINLIYFNDSDYYRISDHLIARRGKGKGLYLAGVPYDASKENGFFLRFNKISATECEFIVEEKVSLSSKDSNLRLYEDDHVVNRKDLSYRELIDLMTRIRQCTPETLLESMFPRMLDSRKVKFSKICDENGKIKDEYKDEDIYELFEKTISREDFDHNMFTLGILEDSLPLMNRGWSKSYKFTIDISDAIMTLDESQKNAIPAIENRIREALIENIPSSIETRVINRLDLSEIAENIAIRDARCEIGISAEIEDFDGDVEELAVKILEFRPRDNIIFGTSDGAKQIVSLRKSLNSGDRPDHYRLRLYYDVTIDGRDNHMICKDGHVMWLEDFIENAMIENQLSEGWYDMVRDEIFRTYHETSIYNWDSNIILELDFSDLFE